MAANPCALVIYLCRHASTVETFRNHVDAMLVNPEWREPSSCPTFWRSYMTYILSWIFNLYENCIIRGYKYICSSDLFTYITFLKILKACRATNWYNVTYMKIWILTFFYQHISTFFVRGTHVFNDFFSTQVPSPGQFLHWRLTVEGSSWKLDHLALSVAF